VVTLRGKHVRVEVYRVGDEVELCISPVYDVGCEDSVVLIARPEELREKAEELVSEIATLVRRALGELASSARSGV
jgi:hypothetical protein